jgi:hypothetical protein
MEMTIINLGFEKIAVYYTYESDTGYERDKNGDGLPPSIDLEIERIEWNGMDVTNLLFDFSEQAMDKITEQIIEKHTN